MVNEATRPIVELIGPLVCRAAAVVRRVKDRPCIRLPQAGELDSPAAASLRRQERPWVRIDSEYRFESDEGSAIIQP